MNTMKENADLPRVLPQPVLELCQRLEERGIATWSQGEGLLDDLRGLDPLPAIGTGPGRTRCLICATSPSTLLRALPRAVVTASHTRRLMLATAAGPIDLLPLGSDALEARLLDFGLSPLAFAFRPTREEWCDPIHARAAFDRGLLDLAIDSPETPRDPFEIAPRRYWIAARLSSEYALEPTANLMQAACAALPQVLERLPQAAPARREIHRILTSPNPQLGLAFLRRSGLSAALFPGMDPAGESWVPRLDELPALRWAVWLRGSAIQRALVRLRMPPALARRIERLNRAHPIDDRVESLREAGIRKLLSQHPAQEIDGLFAWRRLELAAAAQTEETRIRCARLDEIEARFETLRHQRERNRQVRELALDGRAIMAALGAGPGRHVGRALAHLALFIEANPEANERAALERELADWAARNALPSDGSGQQKSAGPAEIG